MVTPHGVVVAAAAAAAAVLTLIPLGLLLRDSDHCNNDIALVPSTFFEKHELSATRVVSCFACARAAHFPAI